MRARTVLVIDDDEDVRSVVEFSLELGGGWRVMGEGNGDNAVARAVEVGPDVILLDVNLGQQDGATVLAALRADARTTGIPVLFLTANVRAADVARLRALGAGVLAKPFDPLTLGAKIAAEMGWAS